MIMDSIQNDESSSLEDELARFEAEERVRLGLARPIDHWTDAMIDPNFTAKERAHTTLLVGGLTIAHDFLVEGALKGLGYNCRRLDCPDNDSLRFGKEFGNVSQCNPTYFTVGNLVKELSRLRDEEGLTSEQVVKQFIFLTAGACGPCRFGMYVTEYRKALRDAGFDGFRVMLFQQTGGIKQASGEELGLPLDPPFFLAIARALFAGDVINVIGYRIRPYEREAGSTDRALDAVKRDVYAALQNHKSVIVALYRGRKHLENLAVDRTQPKPKVSILGEFWAMTTEGDGNYHLQQFIEQEGGENEIQILAYLLLYNLWEMRHDTEQRIMLKHEDGGQFGLRGADVGLRMAGLWVGELALRVVFQTFAKAIGLRRFHLPDMEEVARAGHSHYNQELRGGEGHMEVAKLILNVVKSKAHMTLSVKPFGCMPSSGVSDGVQSVVTELFPDAIFCAVETSGEGAVNFQSRVQLFLFKAKQRAVAEMNEALAQYGITRKQAQEFLASSPYGRALYRAPHAACGSGADLIHQIGPLVGRSRLERARIHAGRAVAAARSWVTEDLAGLAVGARRVAPYLPAVVKWAASEGLSTLPAMTQNLRATAASWLEPSAEQKAEIARAEVPAEPAVKPVQLRKRTKSTRRAEPAIAEVGAAE
jgi:predicted nucleotide-binding protein (sugar kinase/HSP70/actin superfamily)